MLLSNLFRHYSTIQSLGLANVLRVLSYRLKVSTGYFALSQPIKPFPRTGQLFTPSNRPQKHFLPPSPSDDTEQLLHGNLPFFSNRHFQMGTPPNWFLNPYTGKRVPNTTHWSRSSTFAYGDVKIIWESSRFDWALKLAAAYNQTGKQVYLDTLNKWGQDWLDKNPLNRGPNWKCGQETSIRLLNMLLSTLLLSSDSPQDGLLRIVIERHCQRISTTLDYAVAQQNNHSISESAALYIAGAWLLSHNHSKRAERWHRTGKYLLETQTHRLIKPDGTFSQYSTNYHRLMLDMLCQAELWRRQLGLQPLNSGFYERAKLATNWLTEISDLSTGNAPNWGENDGARLFELSDASFSDYRTTIQNSNALFHNKRVLSKGPWDLMLKLFKSPSSYAETSTLLTTAAQDFPSGGLTIFKLCDISMLIRYANFCFRPGHADIFHVDMSVAGKNLLRDGGTYSYNTDPHWRNYFTEEPAHNTIQFDDNCMMPRLGRFIFGDWVTMETQPTINTSADTLEWSGSYRQRTSRARHTRSISLQGKTCRITDEIDGFKSKAILRWRLSPDKWSLTQNICTGPRARIKIESSAPGTVINLESGWESLHYLEKTKLPVLTVLTTNKPTTIVSEITID